MDFWKVSSVETALKCEKVSAADFASLQKKFHLPTVQTEILWLALAPTLPLHDQLQHTNMFELIPTCSTYGTPSAHAASSLPLGSTVV
jgi:hypothetical protein